MQDGHGVVGFGPRFAVRESGHVASANNFLASGNNFLRAAKSALGSGRASAGRRIVSVVAAKKLAFDLFATGTIEHEAFSVVAFRSHARWTHAVERRLAELLECPLSAN